ncbi:MULTISPECIES: type II toxin-antitoxin system RelE/ParE family toxin [Xenorhabdus]|uniref:type II toxin-antitoxin system RelE/ParE family toxin n=1 Tax=Xenorhabdus TaxID=626 RepID=UPI0006473C96|nr:MULTISPECIES: type II toxin-antitoxin system RelE/ParE family toxin [Xenorhabdus]MBC8947377.1 plasmid stabilization protein ParE [Xenorhabdus indica]
MDYVLTEAAEADLRSIISYTRKQWGNVQARRYVTTLKKGIERLACGKGSFKDMSELFPALRMARCEHHYVFCLPRDGAPALIVAIFHEKMDLLTRLTDRLL